MKETRTEKGQILVIMVVALVALLAVTALALDGTTLYSERRNDQSTADSASLAGAGAAAQYLKENGVTNFTCGTTAANAALAAAIAQAQSAALVDEVSLVYNDISTNNGVTAQCISDSTGEYIEIHTVVTTDAKSNFLGVVSKQDLTSVVDAVSRVYVNESYAGGNALVSLGTTCDTSSHATGGIYALGNGQVRIHNGGAYSASCIQATGSSKMLAYDGVIQYTGANNLIIANSADGVLVLNDTDSANAPNIDTSWGAMYNYAGVQNPSIASSLWPIQAPTALTPLDIDPMLAISAPTCGSTQTTTSPAGSGATIQPGTYSSMSWGSWGSGALNLASGTYCFNGTVSMSGGAATVNAPNTSLYFKSGSTFSNAFSSNNLSYSMDGSTIYIDSGNLVLNRPVSLNNSKIYINSGNLTINGSAVVNMDNSSIYLKNGTFTVTAGGKLYADNITIYIKQGNFTIEGGAVVDMSAPDCSTSACGVGPAIPGLLVYMDESNTGTFNINNGTGTAHNMEGTCYCPNAVATIDGGTSTTTTNVQLIAKAIAITSGAVLNMDLDNASLYSQGSTTIELTK